MDKYENTARELSNRIFEPFDIKELAEVSGNSLEIHDLMNLLLEKAMSATKAQIGSVCIFESDKQRLHVVASKDLEAKPKKDFFINLNESLAEIVVSDRKPFLVKDIETDMRTNRPNNSKYGSPSFLIMPICVRGDLIAVLNLANKRNDQIFSSDDEHILSTVIREVGISLENVWLHSTVDNYLKNYQKSTTELTITNRKLKQEITRRRQLEAALKESETRCRNILESIEEGFFEKEKLESQLRQAQKMEAVGTLSGGIAHDFNNMLQAITGNAQILLMQKKAGEPDYRKLKAIERSAMRASDLTRQLLLFGRQADSNLEPVDLNYEIKNTSKLLKHTIPKMIDIELKIEETLNIIEANPVQIEQIIMNLAVNARDAMPDGGKLIFKTENVIVDEFFCKTHSGITPGEYILFTISDTGHGVDKRLLGHIFEPFYTTK
ncbi:MAG: GAF domain-containing protein, partial [Thermodesulfobacteriota bacterium]|nr:GAF domain-containing protein [Thermodesulfobacteriota bacterium]